ncbi:hypothetical protein BS47DRAFT_1391993 [Hydnum rufescens UP504]|uniref:Uncharacterized protein n=1 Tax=Hydnum rufescens UP504 TaxID=1448309 RepID=A0A9P6AZH8_9AGAM|nr:hypothetical protein BS47DRAFT_1391993 [Hydnum rufescens UP504]
MPSLSIPMTISTFLTPPPSLTKLSLNEWVSVMTTKTLDPCKRDSFMYKDKQMPFGGAMSLKSTAREKPNDHKASPAFLVDTLELYGSFPDSYHAYLALRQAMEACKANHCNHVESICVNYYDKRKLDIEDIMKILSLLHRTLSSHKFEIMAMIDTVAALTCQTHSLDEQCRKLKETESETVKNHKDSVDLYAKAMAGQGQSQAIAQPHSSISAFTPDSESIACYSQVVQGLQLKLYDHEWSELKDDINKYEYTDLPWSQTVQELCGDPSLEHEDDGW